MPDFGADISTYPDLDVTFTPITGRRVVAEAVARRLITPNGGGLFYDQTFGFDTRGLLNAPITTADLAVIAARVEQEALKDERVLGCSATVTFDTTQTPGVLSIRCLLTLATGPFALTLKISAVEGLKSVVFGT